MLLHASMQTNVPVQKKQKEDTKKSDWNSDANDKFIFTGKIVRCASTWSWSDRGVIAGGVSSEDLE